MKNKKCNDCGMEFITYGSECPICKSMDVTVKEEKEAEKEEI